jgi:hypothetical protein
MLLPAIGLGLSALAVLAALWLSLRMMTLETSQLVAQEIDEIKAQRVSFDPDTQAIDDPLRDGHRRIRGRYRFLLLVPSLLLMLGSSALLYMNSSKDCNIIDQGANGDTGDDS